MNSRVEKPDRIVGVCDIGGTQLRVALADRAGNLHAKRAMTHTTREFQDVLEILARELNALAQEHNVALQGIGVSVPGPLDAARGFIYFSPNLGWREVAFADELGAKLKRPVVLDDDANCAALGEQWRGAGKATRNFVYMIVGTGIGGGLILDGKIYRGASGSAGEIGHTTIVADGPLCACGNRGCLEALAAGPALVRRANEIGLMCQTARQVISAARRDDERAVRVLREAARCLGIGLANLVNLLNPAMIVLGGGVALDAGELLLTPARDEMRQRALAAARIELARLGDDAGLVGAARLILESLG